MRCRPRDLRLLDDIPYSGISFRSRCTGERLLRDDTREHPGQRATLPGPVSCTPPDARHEDRPMTPTPLTRSPQDSGAPSSARDFGVEGRTVIITGAAQGIGRELA